MRFKCAKTVGSEKPVSKARDVKNRPVQNLLRFSNYFVIFENILDVICVKEFEARRGTKTLFMFLCLFESSLRRGKKETEGGQGVLTRQTQALQDDPGLASRSSALFLSLSLRLAL